MDGRMDGRMELGLGRKGDGSGQGEGAVGRAMGG